jgi:tRNA 5-methylaminomethyl-2-thiouridine biosynthesis bifunctional protein
VENNQFDHDLFQVYPDELNINFDDNQELVFFPHAGFVYPGRLCQQILSVCGDALRLVQSEVTHINNVDGLWQCCRDDETVAKAEVVVFATNRGFKAMRKDFPELPVDAYSGTSISFTADIDQWPTEHVVNAGHYVVPPIDGVSHVGATFSERNQLVISDDGDIKALMRHVNRLFSFGDNIQTLHDRQSIASWSGIRGIAPDRLPVIGACPDTGFYLKHYHDIENGDAIKEYPAARYHNGIYYSLAHGSRGFTTSFLAAEVIASMVEQGPMPVTAAAMNAVAPSRFIVNQLKRGAF